VNIKQIEALLEDDEDINYEEEKLYQEIEAFNKEKEYFYKEKEYFYKNPKSKYLTKNDITKMRCCNWIYKKCKYIHDPIHLLQYCHVSECIPLNYRQLICLSYLKDECYDNRCKKIHPTICKHGYNCINTHMRHQLYFWHPK
jgi:hypothetical protein